MDAVITYVNMNDPLWQQDYERTVGRKMLAKRFRDWGTLPYLFRGIGQNMPFVDRVFLVVARESQVPAWVNRKTVQVVLHRDFIPEAYLPTFNASMIEMFLHRIPGLGERFLYLNDDIFPLRRVRETDFFQDGKPVKKLSRHLFSPNAFKRLCRNSDRLARETAGLPPSPWFLRPQHSITPMLRSACEEVFRKAQDAILSSLSPVREDGNFNQYLFSDYMYYRHLAVSRRISHRHISMGALTASSISAYLKAPKADFAGLNDVEMSPARFEASQAILLEAFEQIFPKPSRYEV